MARQDAGVPSPEWFRLGADMMNSNVPPDFFRRSIIKQLDMMKSLSRMPKDGLDIAVDMHKIPRYDHKHGPELTRSRSRKGTDLFERCITVQSVYPMRLVLAVLPMRHVNTAAEFVPKIMEICKKLGIRIRLLMADREFFSAECICNIERTGVPHLIPCKNTDRTVQRIREYDSGTAGRTSEMILTSADKSVPYTDHCKEKECARQCHTPGGAAHRVCKQRPQN